MSVARDFISGDGPHLVEASAGTGKTTWMVRTATRFLLGDAGMPKVGSPERLLAVTFTRAATAELKERLRDQLLRVAEIAGGRAPEAKERWVTEMLEAGKAPMHARLADVVGKLDKLTVTTIHGFCMSVLEEFALECGLPAGLRFVEDVSSYLHEAAADEWRVLTWADNTATGLLEELLRAGPDALVKAAGRVRGAIGVPRPPRCDRDAVAALAREGVAALEEEFDETALQAYIARFTWKQEGLSTQDVRAMQSAFIEYRETGALHVDALRRWTSAGVRAGVNKRSKGHEQVDQEPFLGHVDAAIAIVDRCRQQLAQDVILAVVERAESAMRRDRVAGFDDMIALVDATLASPTTGPALRSVLAARYDAVLVDEFQDTDWAQWRIFSGTFGQKPLVVVGDPKQSIYGFRGADITAYRAARAAASRVPGRIQTLSENYRSDAVLVEATSRLFESHERPFAVEPDVLRYEPVQAARTTSTLQDPTTGALVLHWLGKENAAALHRKAVRDVAAEIARLLSQESVRVMAENSPARAVVPSDIAILVHANRFVAPLIRALRERGVAAVAAATGDIVDSESWDDLRQLVRAIEDPGDARQVRRALVTPLLGHTANMLLDLDQNAALWHREVEALESARHEWVTRGGTRTLARLFAERGVIDALTRRADGERRLTDLRHIQSLVQKAEAAGERTPAQLLSWMQRMAEEESTGNESRQLQLESDRDAVLVSTIHAAKGLEWPIVFCPFEWVGRAPSTDIPRVAQFADGSRHLVFSAEPMPDEIPGDSALAERMRLFYVAMTRARWRTYLFAGQSPMGSPGATHHLLGEHQELAIQTLAVAHPGLISQRLPGAGTFHALAKHPAEPAPIVVAPIVLADTQRQSWEVSSYTRLARGLHSRAEEAEIATRLDDAEAGDSARADAAGADLLLGTALGTTALPGGAHTGEALHKLFETIDFPASADERYLEARIASILDRFALPRADASDTERAAASDVIRRMVRGTLATPMASGIAPLLSVESSATLREWRFQIPMDTLTVPGLVAAFRRHGAPWLASDYAAQLERAPSATLNGFLTGVIDLVACVDSRWWIVDWKSNALGDSAAAFAEAGCRRAMQREHYVLQYHLYVVALHRFLRVRLGAGYDYERDIGGVGYAFLRGLAIGTGGWFFDRPSAELVDALDAAVGGSVRA